VSDRVRQFIFGLIAAVIGELLGLKLTNDFSVSTLFACNTYCMGVILEWLIFELPQDRRRLNNIENKIRKMIEHSALYTENNEFGKLLEKLRTTPGRITWVVADFISKKLKCHFPSDDFIEHTGVGPISYSDWVSQWLDDCEKSVWFIIPFTPRAWFEALLQDALFNRIGSGLSIPDKYLPKHILALRACRVADKKRIVIVTSEEWGEMLDQGNIPYLREFIRINSANAELYFIISDVAQNALGMSIIRKDCIILDEQILLEWEPNKGCLILRLHRETVAEHVNHYRRLLSYRSQPGQNFCYTADQIQNLLSRGSFIGGSNNV
jgi:hypothetical protein